MLSRRDFIAMATTLVGGGTVLALTGCNNGTGTTSDRSGSGSATSSSNGTASSDSATAPDSAANLSGTTRRLVVDFSWSGNTWKMAQRFSDVSGADLFRIEPVDAYSDDYNETVDRARSEQDDDTMPDYQGDVDGWADYDLVFLGYPIWWSQLPQVVKHFISDHDWAGKQVVLFDSHLGSGWSDTPDEVSQLCSPEHITRSVSISGSQVDSSLDQIDDWLQSQGLAANA